MQENRTTIEDAIDILKENLDTVARVTEWAELMGYEKPKLFSRHFLKYHEVRPSKVLTKVRLKSIIAQLRKDSKSCLKIAWAHSLPDEKALYNFVKRHLNVSPTEIKMMTDKELQELLEKSGSKFGN